MYEPAELLPFITNRYSARPLGALFAKNIPNIWWNTQLFMMGAPCYWGNIPGQMKLLFDRIVYGMMRDTPRFPEPSNEAVL